MFCCACAGVCNHVGPHSFCAAHGGMGMTPATPGQLKPPLQNTVAPYPHAACDQRIAQLEAENAKLRAALERIGEFPCDDPFEDRYCDCKIQHPDEPDEWCPSCLARSALAEIASND